MWSQKLRMKLGREAASSEISRQELRATWRSLKGV